VTDILVAQASARLPDGQAYEVLIFVQAKSTPASVCEVFPFVVIRTG
jgi:hypothetical protein